MGKYKSYLSTLSVPVERLSKTLRRNSEQILRETARTWLRFMLTEIPVETGMAKGTLKPLGQFLRVAVPISPVRKEYYSKLEGGIQNIAFGAEKSAYSIDYNNGIYTFEWDTETRHYWLKEFYGGDAIPGQDLIQLADDEAQNYLIDALSRRIPISLQGFIEFSTEVG